MTVTAGIANPGRQSRVAKAPAKFAQREKTSSRNVMALERASVLQVTGGQA